MQLSVALFTFTKEIKNAKGQQNIFFLLAIPKTVFNPFYREEKISGVVVYGITCGILIVFLLIAFCIAYKCKWKLLMDAMEEYYLMNEKKGSTSNGSILSDMVLPEYNDV